MQSNWEVRLLHSQVAIDEPVATNTHIRLNYYSHTAHCDRRAFLFVGNAGNSIVHQESILTGVFVVAPEDFSVRENPLP